MKILLFIPHHSLLAPQGTRSRLDGLLKLISNFEINFVVPEQLLVEDLLGLPISGLYRFREPSIFSIPIPYWVDFSPNYLRSIQVIIAKVNPEIVIFDYPWGLYGLSKISKIPLIYFSQGVERDFVPITLTHMGMNNFVLRRLLQSYIGWLERKVCSCAKLIITMSELDSKRYLALYGGPKEKYLDLPQPLTPVNRPQKFAESTALKKLKIRFGLDPERPIIMFHGSYRHLPNREAFDVIIQEVAPLLMQQRSDVQIVLAGPGLDKFSSENIISLGFVDDIEEVISCADLAIVPMFQGCGVRMKILDYLRHSCPLISTQKGVEGLAIQPSEHFLLVEDSATAIVRGVVALLENEVMRHTLASNGIRYISEFCRADHLREKLLNSLSTFLPYSATNSLSAIRVPT